MVENYQEKKAYLVLSLVRKYPLYSLDKLAEELPGISRHSIQRILEKNSLSTVGNRLAYSADNKRKISFSLKNLQLPFSFFSHFFRSFFQKLGNLKNLVSFRQRWRFNLSLSKSLLILTFLVICFAVFSYISSKSPEITLDQPEVDFSGGGESLFVSGKVNPRNSKVLINGEKVALNGSGSFTAVVKIPVGETTLRVEAFRFRKASSVVRLVNRILTQEEIKAKANEEATKKREATDRAAELERTVNDLLAAKNAAGEEAFLRIFNNRIKVDAGFSSVVGEVRNFGTQDATWVMITANFYNQAGSVIDTKYGFATEFGQVLEPGESRNFETQPTTKEFDNYGLAIGWEKPAIAGVATESAAVDSGGL